MLTAWPAEDLAVVITVGRHDRSATDVYDLLLAALDIEASTEEREKPACCDEAGEPPIDAAVEAIADAIERIGRRRRRG